MRKIVFVVSMVALALLITPHFIALVHAAEPTLPEILSHYGYTNISLDPRNNVTFPPGTYKITLLAEFAGFNAGNELDYYEKGTSTFLLVFSGPEGNFGYTSPLITKTFKIDYEFGLSMYVNDQHHRYFTENSRNGDGQTHSRVYQNLDDPTMYFVGMENMWGRSNSQDAGIYCEPDRDYQDIVVSIQKLPDFTVPEIPLGILMTMISMIMALAGYIGFKRFRKQSLSSSNLHALP